MLVLSDQVAYRNPKLSYRERGKQIAEAGARGTRRTCPAAEDLGVSER